MLRTRNGDAAMKVFVSYSHAQSDWVQDRLVPVLEAGGASVFVDYRHFAAGHTVIGQMDKWQDQAERHVLVLSEQYVASDGTACHAAGRSK
jgi:hypothetical protein